MAQQTDVAGDNNIVVQIEGDRNQVNLKGLVHDTLTCHQTRREIQSEADLLSYYIRSILLVAVIRTYACESCQREVVDLP